MVSDGSSQAEKWTDLRKQSCRCFFLNSNKISNHVKDVESIRIEPHIATENRIVLEFYYIQCKPTEICLYLTKFDLIFKCLTKRASDVTPTYYKRKPSLSWSLCCILQSQGTVCWCHGASPSSTACKRCASTSHTFCRGMCTCTLIWLWWHPSGWWNSKTSGSKLYKFITIYSNLYQVIANYNMSTCFDLTQHG